MESLFLFFSQKVKFWGLIFQSGPGNWKSTFWKTAAIKLEKVKLLPLCHCSLWPDWTARGNWENSLYFFHRKRPSMTSSIVRSMFDLICFLRMLMELELATVFSIDFNFCIPMVIEIQSVLQELCATFFLSSGVRQEQDIYVRLIDSVTKQVCYLPKLLEGLWKKVTPNWIWTDSQNENKIHLIFHPLLTCNLVSTTTHQL